MTESPPDVVYWTCRCGARFYSRLCGMERSDVEAEVSVEAHEPHCVARGPGLPARDDPAGP